MLKYIFYLALLMLPFSTNSGDKSVVLSYGLPFFAILIAYLLLFKEYKIDKSNFTIAILTFIWIGCIVSFSIISSTPLISFARSIVFAIGGFLFLLLISKKFSDNIELTQIVKKSIMIFGCALAAYYLIRFGLASIELGIQKVLIERYVGGAASLPWGASNVVSSCLLLALTVACIDNVRTNSKFSLFTMILTILAMVSTISRTAILLLCILMLSTVIIGRRGRLVTLFVFLCFGAVLIALLALSSNDAYIQILVTDRLNTEGLSTLNTRSGIWTEIIKQGLYLKPLGYYGLIGSGNQSGHSIIFTTLAEQGIIGLIILLLFWTGIIVKLLNITLQYPNQKSIWITLVGFLVITADLLVEDPYFTQQYALVFWITLSFIISEAPYREFLTRTRRM